MVKDQFSQEVNEHTDGDKEKECEATKIIRSGRKCKEKSRRQQKARIRKRQNIGLRKAERQGLITPTRLPCSVDQIATSERTKSLAMAIVCRSQSEKGNTKETLEEREPRKSKI